MAHPKHSNPLMPSESDDDNGFDSNPLQGQHNNQHHQDCGPLFEAADEDDSHCFGALVSGEEETSNEEGSGDSTTANNIFNLGTPSLGMEVPQHRHTHKTSSNCIVGLENVSSSGGPLFDLRIDCQSDDCYYSSTASGGGGGSVVSLGFVTSNGGGGGAPLTPSSTTITTRNSTFLAPATSPAHAEASPMMLRRVLSNGRMKPSDKSSNSSTLRGPLSADSTPTHADQPKSANPSDLPPLANNVIDSSQDRPFYIPQLDGICHTFLGRPAVDCTANQRMRNGDDDGDDTDGTPLACWLSPSGARKRSGGGGDFALDEDALGCNEGDDDAPREEKVSCSNPLTLTPPRSPRLSGLGFRIGSEDHSPQAPSNRFVLAQSDPTGASPCSSSSLLGGNIVAAKILNRISADDEADGNGQPSLPCFRPPPAGFAGCSLPGGGDDDDNESTSRRRAVPHRLLLSRRGEQSDPEHQPSAEELRN